MMRHFMQATRGPRQATRGARKAKRPAGRAAKARGSPGSAVLPFFMGAVAGAVVTLGIVYLYPERAAPVEVDTAPKEPEITDFEFRRRLPDSFVPTDTEHYGSGSAPSEPREYRIQVASFKDRARADSLRAELLLDGHPATVEPGRGGEYHAVMVGPFESRVSANRTMTALRGHNLSPIMLDHEVAQ